MSDLISRGRLRGELAYTDFNDISDWQKINKIVNKQPDGRHKGHWIPLNPGYEGFTNEFKCSECGKTVYIPLSDTEIDYQCCPYCGSITRKETKR